MSLLSRCGWNYHPLHLIMVTPLNLAISQNFQITAYRITPSKEIQYIIRVSFLKVQIKNGLLWCCPKAKKILESQKWKNVDWYFRKLGHCSNDWQMSIWHSFILKLHVGSWLHFAFISPPWHWFGICDKDATSPIPHFSRRLAAPFTILPLQFSSTISNTIICCHFLGFSNLLIALKS